LHSILVEQIERYYDTSLDDEVADKAADIESELYDITASVHERHAEDIDTLESERKKVVTAIKAFKRKATPILRKIQNDLDAEAPDIDSYEWPEPQDGDEDDDPMFDSTRSYLDQIDRYKRHQGKSSERKPRKQFKLHACTCEVCGKSFLSRRPKAQACNPSHRTKLWRQANS